MFEDIFLYEGNLLNGPTLYVPWECPVQEYRLPFVHKHVRNVPTAYAEPLLTVMLFLYKKNFSRKQLRLQLNPVICLLLRLRYC